jgi:hypothetical protein
MEKLSSEQPCRKGDWAHNPPPFAWRFANTTALVHLLHFLAATFGSWRLSRGLFGGIALITDVALIFSLGGWGSFLFAFMLATTVTTAHELLLFVSGFGYISASKGPKRLVLGWSLKIRDNIYLTVIIIVSMARGLAHFSGGRR